MQTQIIIMGLNRLDIIVGYDCPLFPDVFKYTSYVAGATIMAAKLLTSQRCDIAINWFGGWHHAKR